MSLSEHRSMSADSNASHSLWLAAWILTAVTVMLPFGSMSAQEGQPAREVRGMREQFVPVEELDAVFSRDRRGVMMKREEFRQLLEKARANAAAGQTPVPILVEQATLTVNPAGQQAVIRMDLKIRQFEDRWQIVRIPAGNLFVEKAEIDGQPAIIGRDTQDGNILMLAHQKSGQFVVSLTLSTPLASAGSDRTAAFQLPQVPATRMAVQCPAGQRLVVNDRQLDRPAAADAVADYVLPVGNAADVRLRWNVQQRETEAQTLVFVHTDAQLEFRRETLLWSGSARISVFGGTISRLVARVPARFEVVSVESAGLEGWTLEDDAENPGKTRVTMTWRQPFSGDRLVKISGVTVTSAGQTTVAAGVAESGEVKIATELVPTVEFVDVTSHSGRLVVRHEDGLRLVSEVQGGIRAVSAVDSGLSLEVSVFEFWQQQYDLKVSVRPRDRELFAEVSADIEIAETSVRCRTQFVIESLNAPLFEVPVKLPADWQLISVKSGDQDVPWNIGADASTFVVHPPVPIPAGALYTLSLELMRTISDPDTEQKLQLPVATATGMTVVGGTWRLHAGEDLVVTPLSLTGLTPIVGNGVDQMFRNEGTGITGELSIVRKPWHLAGRSVLRTWADSRQQTVDAELTVDVLTGTVRTLVIELAESLGTDVHFEVRSVGDVAGLGGQKSSGPVQIVEQSPGPAVDGLRPVTLKMDRRVSGSVTLHAMIRQSRTEGMPITAPVVQVANANRQHGVLVFEAYPEQSFGAQIEGIPGLSAADAGLVSMPVTASGRRIALTYRFVQPGYRFQVTETRYDTAPVPSAICEEIQNICTLNASGHVQRNSIATFQTSGVQTLRFQLPASQQTYLWSTVLDGEAIEVRRDGEDYLVALPTDTESARHTLSVLFETGETKRGTFQNQNQVPVLLLMDVGEKKSLPIEVLKQTWQVHYSPDSLVVDHDGPYRSVTGVDTVGWLVSLGRIQWPSTVFLLSSLIPVGVFFLTLFVLTVLIVRRRWKTLIAVGLMLGGCGVLLLGVLGFMRGEMAPTSQRLALESVPRFSLPPGDGGWTDAPAPDAMSEEAHTAGDEGYMGGMGGMGGGGMGGGGMAGEQAGLLQPPSAGGFPGGSRSQEIPQSPPAPTPEVVSDQDLQVREPQRQLSGQVQPTDPLSALDDTSVLSRNARAEGEDRSGGQAAVPQTQLFDTSKMFGINAVKKRGGTARLSVNVKLEIPENYRMQEFVSVADTVYRPSALSLAMRSREQVTVIRLLAAISILMLVWCLRRVALLSRLALSSMLLLASLAVVPLVSNAWQSLLDGFVCGSALSAMISVSAALMKCCCGPYCPLTWCLNCCGLRQKFFGAVTLLAALGGLSNIAGAQEANVAPAAVNGENATPSVQAGATESVMPTDLVIPYTADQPVLRADRVFIRHDDFLKLYRQAWPDALPELDNNPLGSSVVAVWLRTGDLKQATGTKYVQSFEGRFVVWSDSEQSVGIPLPLGPVGIRSIQVDGGVGVVTPLVTSVGGGQMPDFAGQQILNTRNQAATNSVGVGIETSAYEVQVSGRGAHVVDVVFDLTAEVEGDLGRCDLPLRAPATGTLEWTLPADGLDAKVNGRTNVYRRDGRTVILPIARAGTLRLQWLPTLKSLEGDRNFHSTATSALSVQNTGLVLRTAVEAEVRQGEISELEVTIPEGFSVQSVMGDDLAGWTVQNTDSSRSLALQFRRAVNDRTSVTFQLFATLPAAEQLAAYSMPIAVVKGSSRDTGTVVLRTGTEFQVRSDALAGVTQLNPDEAPVPPGEALSGRAMLAWRYTRHPASVVVRISPALQEQSAEAWHAMRLEEQRQLWTSRINLQVKGAPRSRLDLRIPKGFLPLDVKATAMKDWYLVADEDPASELKTLSLQLADARTGALQIVVQGQMDRDADRQQLTLRPPVLKGSQISTSGLAVWLAVASESTGVDAGSDWTPRSPLEGQGFFREVSPAPPALYFQSSALEPAMLRVRLRPAISTLIGESVTVSSVTETSLEVMLAMRWQIARAAADQFAIEIPESMSRVMTFDVPGQRKLVREAVANGKVRVIFQLQQPVTDQFFILGTASLPLPADRMIRMDVPQMIVPEGVPSTLSGQSHFRVIVNQSVALLKAETEQPDDVVGPDQITTQIPPALLEQAVLISKLRPESSAWQIVSPEQQKVAPAVANLVTHTTVLSEDGSWRSRHQLQVTNESRQFLPVILPQASRVMYCKVAGNPSRIVQTGEGDKARYLIPIPQSGALAAGFDVDFAIAGRFEGTTEDLQKKWLAETLAIPIPTFPEFRDDAEFGISISRNRWSVYVPNSWRARVFENPEKTNVVQVTEDQISDAAVLSEIDQALSLFARQQNDSAGDNSEFSGGTQWYFQTLDRLQNVRGKSLDVEQQRGDVLNRLNTRVRQSAVAPTVRVQQNEFLYSKDMVQNRLFKENKDRFFFGNGMQAEGNGTTRENSLNFFGQLPQLEQSFEFDLNIVDENLARKQLEQLEKKETDFRDLAAAKSGKSQAADKESGEKVQELDAKSEAGAAGRRSSGRALLRRRLSETEGLEEKGKTDAAAAVPPAVAGPGGMQGDGIEQVNVPAALEEGDFGSRSSVPQASEATGLLSLSFEIPADGYRMDFLRTGGNSSLSLRIWSAEAVNQGVGLIWAFFCGLGVLTLRKASRKGDVLLFVQRVSLMLVLGGLLCLLLQSFVLQVLGLMLCGASSLVFAVALILRSRKVLRDN